MQDDTQQILDLFEDGDRALIAADLAELSRIFADDYVQYDESGRRFTKADVLANLKTGAIRFLSMVSTGRLVRLFGDIAIVHGSEQDEIETADGRSSVPYIYLDVVRKRDGRWQIVASQLARPIAK